MNNRWSRTLVRFLKRENGPTAVEYSVMLALVVVVALIAITVLGRSNSTTFSTVGTKVQTASS